MALHVSEHTDLLRAIAAGDGDTAAHIAYAHVTGFEETIRAIA